MNSFLLVCDMFSFVFWRNLRPEKKTFRDYLTFSMYPILNILLYNSGLQSEFKTFNVQFESRIWSSSVFFWSQFEHVEVETMYYKNVNKILLEFWVNRFLEKINNKQPSRWLRSGCMLTALPIVSFNNKKVQSSSQTKLTCINCIRSRH